MRDLKMTPNEIPDFVDELIAVGCEITAIGQMFYAIGEAEGSAAEKVRRITEKYGDRDQLRLKIIVYLWAIGRYIELPSDRSLH